MLSDFENSLLTKKKEDPKPVEKAKKKVANNQLIKKAAKKPAKKAAKELTDALLGQAISEFDMFVNKHLSEGQLPPSVEEQANVVAKLIIKYGKGLSEESKDRLTNALIDQIIDY